mmetsp:Transcript_10686/g.27413  ORF Transcript_10686/g.27413 Transcript_10686/m.27413 type:complete len:202 (+) Transcript_10686:258-863(+)
MMSHDVMVPKRENMISRSSSVVTGFSLHTNSMLDGGLTSASGRSPIISSTTARDLASSVRMLASISSAVRWSSIGTQSSSSRSVAVSNSGSGDISGMWSSSWAGSSKGSSSTRVWRMRMFCIGRPALSTNASLMLSTMSMPSATSPKMVCLPSSESRLLPVVMKNWLAFIFSPAPAMDNSPLRLCLSSLRISSSKNRAWSP